MTTSVPQVSHITLDQLRNTLGQVMQLAADYAKIGDDIRPLEMALHLMRGVYESQFKPAANLGKMERGLVDQIGRSLERLEANIVNVKAKRAKQRGRHEA